MRNAFRRHPFLLIGLLTLGLFHLAEGLNRAGKTEIAQALAVPMRVLIVPMYVVWLLLTMAQVAIAGPRGLPAHSRLLCRSSSWSQVSALTPSWTTCWIASDALPLVEINPPERAQCSRLAEWGSIAV